MEQAELFTKKKKNPTKFDIQLNEEQKEAKAAYLEHDIIIITGPAGTGKTLLATNLALDSLINTYGPRAYEKIIILRPVVYPDEDLGFLPGDKDAKMGPLMRPVIENFRKLMQKPSKRAALDRYVDEETIEILPIAYSKGITYTDSIVIIDEAEDITKSQMRLLLTRLGKNSKIIITGDMVQQDLKGESGLTPAMIAAEHIDRMVHVKLTKNHRASIVSDILKYF